MKTLILASLLVISGGLQAKEASFKCSTPRNNVTLNLVDNKLKMEGRFPAETLAQRTKKSGDSLTKIFYINGEKHTIYFENTQNLGGSDNFINIKTRRGHEITFPLDCQKS